MMELRSFGSVTAPNILVAYSEVVVGRSPSCHHVINDPAISRRHILLKMMASNKLILEDTSANGVSVNGSVLGRGKSALLNIDDVVSFETPAGQYKFRVGPADGASAAADLDSTVPLNNNAQSSAKKSRLDKAVLEENEQLKKQLAKNQAELEERQDELDRLKHQTDCLRSTLCSSIQQLTQEKQDLQTQLMDNAAVSTEQLQALNDQLRTVESKLSSEIGRRDALETELADNMRAVEQMTFQQLQQRRETMESLSRLADSEITCSICTEFFIDAETLNCGHTFCGSCISEWLATRRLCPICRLPVQNRARSVVVDNVVAAIVEKLPPDARQCHQQLRQDRARAPNSAAIERSTIYVGSRTVSGGGALSNTTSSVNPPPMRRMVSTAASTSSRVRGSQRTSTRSSAGSARVPQPPPLHRTSVVATSRRARGGVTTRSRRAEPVNNNSRSDSSVRGANVRPFAVTGGESLGDESVAVSTNTDDVTSAADDVTSDTDDVTSSPVDRVRHAGAILSEESSLSTQEESVFIIDDDDTAFDSQLAAQLAAQSDSDSDSQPTELTLESADLSGDDDDDVLSVSSSSSSSVEGFGYYGGYGRCFRCGRRGHWAHGCPL